MLAQKNSDVRNNKRDEQFTEFEACKGMPAKGTKLYNWQMTQLSNGRAVLD